MIHSDRVYIGPQFVEQFQGCGHVGKAKELAKKPGRTQQKPSAPAYRLVDNM